MFKKVLFEAFTRFKDVMYQTSATPSDSSSKLHKGGSSPYHDITAYRILVGRLLYLNATRSNITLCTNN